MKEDEIESKILKTVIFNGLITLFGALVFVAWISENGHIPWGGVVFGLAAFVGFAYGVYNRNVEAHYKLTQYAADEYQRRIASELERRRFASLVMSNWFVKLEETLRHKFDR
ncbi:MAG: hypothetical protein HWE08_09060 [Alphaproteobacteria bacterium]|nr:hypothetical protein [Alphaproteobacteria bacterium]